MTGGGFGVGAIGALLSRLFLSAQIEYEITGKVLEIGITSLPL
jgi:hypothetical protein